MNKIILFLIAVSGVSIANAFDLYFAYQKSLDYNAEYLTQIAKTDASQEQKNIASAQLFPQINANVSLSENYFNQAGIEAYYHQPVYGAQLQQVVFDWSKFSAFTKAKYSAQIGSLQLENAKQQLFVTVSQAYFDVLYAKDTLQSIQMTKIALGKQMNQARQSFKVGTVTIADVNDAQSGFDSSAAQEIQAENDLVYKKNVFRNLTGLDPEQIQPLNDTITLALPKPQDISWWAKTAESANLNIKIADKQLAMADQDISIANSGHLPILSANLQYQYTDTLGIDSISGPESQINTISNIPGTPLSSYQTGSAGVQLNIPLYSGGGVSASVRQAKANYNAVNQQLINVMRDTDQNLRNSYWSVQNGVSLVKAQQTALKSAKTKLDSDQLGYQVGIRNSVDLVNSQKNYYNTLQVYQQSRYQYLLAQIQLRYLSGDIEDRFVKNINTNIKSSASLK